MLAEFVLPSTFGPADRSLDVLERCWLIRCMPVQASCTCGDCARRGHLSIKQLVPAAYGAWLVDVVRGSLMLCLTK